jgi:hypothetical protein
VPPAPGSAALVIAAWADRFSYMRTVRLILPKHAGPITETTVAQGSGSGHRRLSDGQLIADRR